MSTTVKVLVVEDEYIVAADVMDRLQALGYELAGHATSGAEAIEKAGSESPQLVLMDIMLKGRMDGVEAAEVIRQRYDIPVVYITAYSDEATLERAKITEPYGYILKPFEERELHTNIEMALYRHSTSRALRENQRWLSAVLAGIDDAVVATDSSHRVVFINPLAEGLTGWSKQEAQGRSIGSVLKLQESYAQEFMKRLLSGELSKDLRDNRIDCTVQSRAEVQTPIELGASALSDDKGQGAGVVLVFSDISERKHYEDALRHAKEHAELIYRVSPSAIYTVDNDRRITSWNNKAQEITGYSAQEILGQPCLLFSDHPCRGHCFLKDSPSPMPLTGVVATIRRKDGKVRTIQKNVDALYDDSGKVVGGIESFEDITEKVQAQKEVEDSELRFRSVVQAASDAIILTDSAGKVIVWNKVAQHVFGYSAEEMLGQDVCILMPERLRDMHLKGIGRVGQGGTPNIIGRTVELVALTKSGQEFPIELSLAQWQSGGEVNFSAIVRDITERKRAEEDLEKALSELNVIFENVSVGILYLKGRRILRVNHTFEQMFACKRAAIEGQSLHNFCACEQECHDLLERSDLALARGEMSSTELVMKRLTGEEFWCRLTGNNLDPSDPARGSIWILVDITARKQTEEELQRAKDVAESMSRAKSEFLANMSHEIRTPMNGILGMTELVLDTGLDDEQREYISIVKQSADSLLQILNDILDFSKIEAGKLTLERVEFSLQDELKRALEGASAQCIKKGIGLTCDIDASVPSLVVGDPVRLRQVVSNLLGNAIKFTHEGLVAVDVNYAAQRGQGEVELRFCVADTGIGIPEEKHGHVFESFTQADGSTTRQYGGTGLGLPISKQIVELMGGRIWLESAPGQGSNFYFTACFHLPEGAQPQRPGRNISLCFASDSKARAAAAGQHSGAATMVALRVLLAEDNAVNQRLARSIIEKAGHSVTIVSTGAEAIEALSAGRFDVVLMDVQMPVLDGIEATARIRSGEVQGADSTVPIVALTAHAMPGDRERFMRSGMDDYISKPFKQKELLSCLQWAAQRTPSPVQQATSQDAALHKEDSMPQSTIDFAKALALLDGDTELLDEICEVYLENAPSQLGIIEEALSSGDMKTVQREAHSMKSASGSIGAHKMQALCYDMEKAGAQADLAQASAILSQLRPEFDRVLKALAGRLRRP